jgi:phage gpG-like protein
VSSSVKFNDNGAMDYARQRALGFLTRAAIEVERRAKELLSVPGTAFATAKGEKGKRLDDQVRSKPGEPPRKQTGRLRGSVTYEVDAKSMVARVGTNVLYGKALELGTKKGLAPRPWLRRALFEMKGKVDELLAQIKA